MTQFCPLFLCQLLDVTRVSLSLPPLQPLQLHSLQSWRYSTQGPWSYTDSFQEQDVVEGFKWVGCSIHRARKEIFYPMVTAAINQYLITE